MYPVLAKLILTCILEIWNSRMLGVSVFLECHKCVVLEQVFVFKKDELDDLTLVHSGHRDILRLALGPHQRRTKDNGHILCLHPILTAELYHSERVINVHSCGKLRIIS